MLVVLHFLLQVFLQLAELLVFLKGAQLTV
jgi:hypothetical protein